MPKKHAPAYSQVKPSYVHPSLESSRPSSSSASPTPQTVNERIQQLRREQAPRATQQRRDEVNEVVTTRTVPPLLRAILRMPEVDAPPPKVGYRSRARIFGTRPPPGPAAPNSWLNGSRYAPDHVWRLRGIGKNGPGREKFCLLSRTHDEEYQRLPGNPSLVHSCLKTFAMNWQELVEYEQYYLPALPVPLKEALLSYLSLYAPRHSVDFKSLKILFLSENEVDGGTGSDEVRFLDLTNLLDEGLTLSDLNKCLTRPPLATSIVGGLKHLSLDSAKQMRNTEADVAESWEDEADEAAVKPLTPRLSVPLFPNLTRLSLAHPGQWASWSELLTLSPRLKTLTHLSLAYWPTPSTTPNAATAHMISKHGKPVHLGGTHFYSELDDDWHEAANVLRRLSLNTYCLKWLDVEGCTWHKALTWNMSNNPSPGNLALNSAADEWSQTASSPGPDWAGAWRQVEYINLFQGWIPKEQHAIMSMPAGMVPVQLLGWLREREAAKKWEVEDKWEMEAPKESGQAVREWVEREKVARSVGSAIAQHRKRAGGKWCRIDHGL